jgi:hypothetical protein
VFHEAAAAAAFPVAPLYRYIRALPHTGCGHANPLKPPPSLPPPPCAVSRRGT